MNCLVVPSVREECFKKFIAAWGEEVKGVEIILVEDNPCRTFSCNVRHHYSWREIDEDLGDDAWVISRQDSAIRSYGFLKAYQMGADYIFTLDDDCHPEDPGFFRSHVRRLEETPRWTELVPSTRTRGLPYKNRGRMSNVVANVGLWTNVPDYDAVQTLALGDVSGFVPPEADRVIPSGQYFPFCGMNFSFRREVAVLSYFPLMGKNSPYRRFDDIWFGVIFKKVCDHLGLAVSVGHPYIRHTRASDPFVNLVKEAPGIQFNEVFWTEIDDIVLTGSTPSECMWEVGASLSRRDGYLKQLGEAITVWARLF